MQFETANGLLDPGRLTSASSDAKGGTAKRLSRR
jgi:hypothetical protein